MLVLNGTSQKKARMWSEVKRGRTHLPVNELQRSRMEDLYLPSVEIIEAATIRKIANQVNNI